MIGTSEVLVWPAEAGRSFRVAAATAVLLAAACAPEPPVQPLLGFDPASAAIERDAEGRFKAGVSSEAMSDMHRLVTARPHVAGSPGSMEVAAAVRRALEEAGLETEVYDYHVLLSAPRSVSVRITGPEPQDVSVIEPASPEDPDSAHAELPPGYVAYSASGSASGQVVYVNYGLPPDYAALEAAGVDVAGKIVLARYARSHRAVKVHNAQTRGARGILMYSDPADDGFVRGDTWPDGPWRADFQIQRGNAKYSWFWHGDPLSPGFAATAEAPVLDAASVPTLPRIPAVPIAWKEAEKILRQLGGPAVPQGFQGGLSFPYTLGPGPVSVTMNVRMEQDRRPVRNVIGRIAGRAPDRWVMLGTHHDAWTFGGMDPGSGLAAVFEVARGLAALRRDGWVPERSIVFAFWDAEEFGLIGSTEYAEAFAADLRAKAVTYINTDLYMRGRFDGGGTPSLRDFLVEVTKDVPAFDGSGSVYDGWRADALQRLPANERPFDTSGYEVELAALGSGADFVAFQDHLGLPTLQMEFDFEGSYGAYHSNYDTRFYVERWSDPGFVVGRALVQVLGLSVMRLASAPVLPFRYGFYARTIDRFLEGASGWADDQAGGEGLRVDVTEARRLAQAIAVRADALERRIDAGLADGSLTADSARALNDGLAWLEQTLLDESEPADRRWYRHVIYGWNIYSLYAGQPLPGLADAIRLRDQAAVDREVARIEAALARMLERIERL
jgi:N-acetylated-alpha-linked acidic dipeptidase